MCKKCKRINLVLEIKLKADKVYGVNIMFNSYIDIDKT